jgi:hypothetical protein
MDNAYVIALIAAMLQVRNAVILSGVDADRRDAVSQGLGDTVEEARELLASIVDETPEPLRAPNTKGDG